MGTIIIIAIIAYVIYLFSKKGEKPISVRWENETEMPYYFFCLFDSQRCSPFIRENFYVTVSEYRITVKRLDRKDIYKILSSNIIKKHFHFECLKEDGTRNRIYFRPDGMMIIYEDLYSDKAMALSQEKKKIHN